MKVMDFCPKRFPFSERFPKICQLINGLNALLSFSFHLFSDVCFQPEIYFDNEHNTHASLKSDNLLAYFKADRRVDEPKLGYTTHHE